MARPLCGAARAGFTAASLPPHYIRMIEFYGKAARTAATLVAARLKGWPYPTDRQQAVAKRQTASSRQRVAATLTPIAPM